MNQLQQSTPAQPTLRKRLAAGIAANVDLRDGFYLLGLTFGAVGGCCLSVPWTLVALGVVLVLTAVLPLGGK